MKKNNKIEVRNPVRIENGVVKEIEIIHINYPESKYDGRKTKWYEDRLKTAEEGEENHVQK